jgi:hypothetical protein
MNSFNHPIKEIIWTENESETMITDEKMNITINGIERLSEQYKEYYTLKQPYDHHTNIPSYNVKEHEDPIFLEIPKDMGQLQVLSQSFISSDVSTFKVGDILNLSSTVSTYTSQWVTITSINISTTVVSFTPSINETTVNMDCYIIARRDYARASYSKFDKNIYVYSFCLNPEEHQPSGSCNFSRLNDCKLAFTGNVSIDKIFAVNYNIMRISNGLVNLRFTN